MNNHLVPSGGSIVPKESSVTINSNLSKEYIGLVRSIVTGYKERPSGFSIDIFFRHMCELDLDFLAGTPLAKYVELVTGEKFEPFHGKQIGEGIIQLKGRSYIPYEFENEVVGHALKLVSKGIDPTYFIENVMELYNDGGWKWIKRREEGMCYSRNLESIAEIALNGMNINDYAENVKKFNNEQRGTVGPFITEIMVNGGDAEGFTKEMLALARRTNDNYRLYLYANVLAPFFYDEKKKEAHQAAQKDGSREISITREEAVKAVLNINFRADDPLIGVYLKKAWERGLDINKRIKLIWLLSSMGHELDSYDGFDVKLHLNSLEAGTEGDLLSIIALIYACSYLPPETSGMDIKINGRKSRRQIARFANDFYRMATVASRDFGKAINF